LSGGAFLLCFARLADLFGRKEIFIISSALFTAFCIAAGFSNSGITLDVLNGFIGLASSAGVPAILGIMGAAYDQPSRRKNYAFACLYERNHAPEMCFLANFITSGAGNPLGFIFGAVIAGIATQFASWRTTYWVLAVIYTIVTAISFFCVPGDDTQKVPLTFSALKTFDFVGTLLTIAGVGLFSAALGLGSDLPEGYSTPYVIVFLVLGAVLIAAFVWWENRIEYPLVPMYIWKDWNFSLLVIILSKPYYCHQLSYMLIHHASPWFLCFPNRHALCRYLHGECSSLYTNQCCGTFPAGLCLWGGHEYNR